MSFLSKVKHVKSVVASKDDMSFVTDIKPHIEWEIENDDVEVTDPKTIDIKWYADFEMRKWGIEQIRPVVPAQSISFNIETSTWDEVKQDTVEETSTVKLSLPAAEVKMVHKDMPLVPSAVRISVDKNNKVTHFVVEF